ncbi:MAG: phosphatidylserine decarboxylase, partial [Lentisphaeria bacterium]|nr:phosphatidylserine decarboxylase [Lentisphaeria bacterium]
RCYSLLDTPRFGRVAMIEIGAFGVGSIVWTFKDSSVRKMQERGYFEFGGSTIVLLLEHGRVRLDPDLIEQSANGFETLVQVGETIGTALDK